MALLDRIPAAAQALLPHVTALRRALHQRPEVGGSEHATVALIEKELDALGIPHSRCGDTGVLGVLCGTAASTGPTVALRADIDALPIAEANDAPYRSQNPGVMHACGHDAHTACLLGAARLLAENRDGFAGQVRLIFQPAEEVGSGTAPFLAAGAMDGVQRVFGLHVAPDLASGTVGLKPGLNNASVDHFTVRIKGCSTHVSTPQLGTDALYIACQTVVALQALVSRCTDPVQPVILGIGRMAAGTVYNAVAATAELEGTTRAVTHEMRAFLKERIDAVVQATAAMYGGSATVEWEDFAPPLLNDSAVTDEVTALVAALWGPGRVVCDRALSLGGDNFADFQLAAPGVYAYLGTADPARPGTCNAVHNSRFDLDENALAFGAGLYAAAALYWLGR